MKLQLSCVIVAVVLFPLSAGSTPTGIAFKNTVILPDAGNNLPQVFYNSLFGDDIAALGDLDGDGYDDVAVVEDETGDGRVHIIFLDADGSVKSAVKHVLGANGLPPPSTSGNFAASIESLGDIDGDGVVDIAVGDPMGGEYPMRYGSVWILFLNSDGSVKSYTRFTAGLGGFVGPLADNARFGSSLAFLGDMDGDGDRELAVGSLETGLGPGSFYILDIDSAGTVTSEVHITNNAAGFPNVLSTSDRFGSALELIDDLDGNGTLDLAVGAIGHTDSAPTTTGAVFVLFMNSGSTVDSIQTIGPASGGLTRAPETSDNFGSALAWLPDVGCTRHALAVGAKFHDGVAQDNGGAVWFLVLDADGTVADETVVELGDPSFPAHSLFSYQALTGDGLASLGDWDGDGITDIAIGASNVFGEGRVGLVTLETLRVEARSIDMGSVPIDSYADTTITITNIGCATRTFPVSLTGSNYILLGPTSVDLEPGEFVDMPVRFAPTDVSNPIGILSTPGGDVTLTGVGFFPVCSGNWNIATFHAENLDTIGGNHALWCGVPGGTPGYEFAPGYGNAWNEVLYWSQPVEFHNVTTEVQLSFVYNADMLGQDKLSIRSYRLGSVVDGAQITGSTIDTSGVFLEPGVFDSTWTVNPVDYVDLGGGQKGIVIRLELITDNAYSDEDFVDTEGAIQIDNIAVKLDGKVVSSADFEPGGSDGGWCAGQSYADPTPETNWSSLFGQPPAGQGLNGEGLDFCLYDGKLVVSGVFTQAGPIAANRVAVWDGGQWSALGLGIGEGEVWGVAEFDGDLFATGYFSETGAGDPAVNIARWDGFTWHAMPAPPGGSNTIWAGYADENYLYASTHTSSPFEGYLAMWNGVSWSSQNLPQGFLILDFEPYQGNLYLTGSVGFGGFLLWWDGSLLQGPGHVFNNDAYAIHKHDGVLYVGGNWNIAGPQGTQPGLARWNGSGWVPSNVDYPIGTAAIGSFNDRLIIAGDFGIRSYDGDTYVPMAADGLYYARDLEIYQGALYVTGLFDHVGGNASYYIGSWTEPVVGVGDEAPSARGPLQVSNYPNPFNPTTTILVQLPEKADVSISIYDVKGRLVRTLESGVRVAGPLYVTWDGTNNFGGHVGSGVYFTSVQAGSDLVTRKIVLLK